MAGSDMPAGFSASAAYVARTFLHEKHLKNINKTMSVRWGKLNSLSAALQLMKAHGVELTSEEEDELELMDEAAQISTLVGKMPTQSNDEFQHFFLKLQLLVQTATCLRVALEEGRTDLVEKALEDAEASGIAQYIVKVAIVQVGAQSACLKEAMTKFSADANSKMGRLVRGQQDCTAAQQILAVAQSQLMRMGGSLVSSLAPFVLGFAGRSDKALLHASFQGWLMSHERDTAIRTLEEEFKDRMQVLEDNLAEWKKQQLRRTSGTMMNQIMDQNALMVHDLFGLWREVAGNDKFNRENADKIFAFQAKLATAKSSFVEATQHIVERFQGSSGDNIIELCLHTWACVVHKAKGSAETEHLTKELAQRKDVLAQTKLEGAKYFLRQFSAGSDSMLSTMCWKAWEEVHFARKREAKLAQSLQAKASNLLSWAGVKKHNVGSCMEGAAAHIEEMMLLRTFRAWKLHKHMERGMKFHQTMVDAKRQQLHGVQHMFRDFAAQLEAGIGKDSHRDLFDRQPVKTRHTRAQPEKPMLQPLKETRALSKTANSVSLPDINAAGSRPGSRGTLIGANMQACH